MPASLLLGKHARPRFPVRMERCLLAFRPGGSLLRAADVPIGTASLEDGAQVVAQFLHCRSAEKPIAVVDLVDTQAGLEYQRVGNHRIVMRVGVFRNVEILLQLAPWIREKDPVSADPVAEFIRLEQVVGGDGHETAVADLHFSMKLMEAFVLPPVFWTEASTREHNDERIALLQLRERTVLAGVVRQLVVGKGCTRNNVGSHRWSPFIWAVVFMLSCLS